MDVILFLDVALSLLVSITLVVMGCRVLTSRPLLLDYALINFLIALACLSSAIGLLSENGPFSDSFWFRIIFASMVGYLCIFFLHQYYLLSKNRDQQRQLLIVNVASDTLDNALSEVVERNNLLPREAVNGDERNASNGLVELGEESWHSISLSIEDWQETLPIEDFVNQTHLAVLSAGKGPRSFWGYLGILFGIWMLFATVNSLP